MNILAFLLAPLALVPAPAQAPAGDSRTPDQVRAAPPLRVLSLDAGAQPAPPFDVLPDGHRVPEQNQVSIEQHVIVRIAPSAADPRARMSSRLPPPEPLSKTFKEKKIDGCLPISAIAGITPSDDNRLLLLLRDRRVVSAALEKSCHVEEFYSGAYIDQSGDGQLCPKREQLQSRTGSKCQVSKLSRLVPRD
ncbi:MAG: hypothetical protein ABIT09_02225 [Croceibacterium sp.]